jgi:hypothetical protein
LISDRVSVLSMVSELRLDNVHRQSTFEDRFGERKNLLPCKEPPS